MVERQQFPPKTSLGARIFRILFLLWVFRSLYIFLSHESASHDPIAALYFAFQEGLMLLPDTLWLVGTAILNFVSPVLSALNLNSRTNNTFLVPAFGILLAHQLLMTCWVVAMRGRGERMWRRPGHLVITEVKARFYYFASYVGVTALLAVTVFTGNPVTALVFVCIACASLMFPILPGLPVWFAEQILDVNFFLLKDSITGAIWNLRRVGGYFRFRTKSDTRQSSDKKRDKTNHTRRERAQQEQPNESFSASGVDYREALTILELKPGYTKSDAINAYKDKMKQHHPDRGGSKEMTKLINIAFDCVKRHHNWV